MLFSDENTHLNCNTKQCLKRKAISCYGPTNLIFGRGNLEVFYSSVFLLAVTAKNSNWFVYCSIEYAHTHTHAYMYIFSIRVCSFLLFTLLTHRNSDLLITLHGLIVVLNSTLHWWPLTVVVKSSLWCMIAKSLLILN